MRGKLGWSKISNDPILLKEFETNEAAYFLSTHRQKEGRHRTAEDDWLNAEWQMENAKKMRQLERLVIYEVQSLYCSPTVYIALWADLPHTMEERETLAINLPQALKEEGFALDKLLCKRAVNTSKTVSGLLEFLTHEIRCAG